MSVQAMKVRKKIIGRAHNDTVDSMEMAGLTYNLRGRCDGDSQEETRRGPSRHADQHEQFVIYVERKRTERVSWSRVPSKRERARGARLSFLRSLLKIVCPWSSSAMILMFETNLETIFSTEMFFRSVAVRDLTCKVLSPQAATLRLISSLIQTTFVNTISKASCEPQAGTHVLYTTPSKRERESAFGLSIIPFGPEIVPFPDGVGRSRVLLPFLHCVSILYQLSLSPLHRPGTPNEICSRG